MAEIGLTPGTFAALLRSKGITSWTALKTQHPDVWRMAIRLNGSPTRVAPNAIQLEPLAQALHLPLAEVQSYAKGEPLSEAQLHRVAKRMAHPGGYGRSNFKSEPVVQHRKRVAATKRRRTGGKRGKPFLPKRGSFGAVMQAQGVESWPDLEERLGSSAGLTVAKSLHREPHRVARNNPALPLIADALTLPLATIVAFARGKKLDDARIKAVQTRLTENRERTRGEKKPKKAKKGVVLATVHVSGGRAIEAHIEEPDGNGHARKKAGRPIGAKTNKLRGAPVEVREIVRTFYATYNMAVLNGYDAFPPVPLDQMGVFLREFLDAKGITIAAMLDPKFKDAFDA